MERNGETDEPKAESGEPSKADGVRVDGSHRRAENSGASPGETGPVKRPGRPHRRWRIRVVRIEAEKYPQFAHDKDHPFAKMAVDARLEEMDSFLARLRARRKPPKPDSGGGLSVAA